MFSKTDNAFFVKIGLVYRKTRKENFPEIFLRNQSTVGVILVKKSVSAVFSSEPPDKLDKVGQVKNLLKKLILTSGKNYTNKLTCILLKKTWDLYFLSIFTK